jgi:hypothetical protein
MSHAENETLYGYVNTLQDEHFFPEKRAGPELPKHPHCTCGHCHLNAPAAAAAPGPGNLDLQVNLQDLLQHAQFSGDPEQ